MIAENSKPKDLAAHVLEKLKHSRLSIALPELKTLEELFECLFYASMKTEESDLIKVTVTVIDPQNPDPYPPRHMLPERWSYVPLAEHLELNIKNLVKISKAADPSSTSLAVYYDQEGKLFIWGLIDQAIHYQSFLNYESESGSEQPGLFQVSINDIGTLNVVFDYELLATLKQHVLIPRYLDVFTIGPVSKILKSNAKDFKQTIKEFLLVHHADEDFKEWESFADSVWIQTLSRLLLRIQNYQHGGAILITDNTTHIDIKYKIDYHRLNRGMTGFVEEEINNYVAASKINEAIDAGKKTISKSCYLDESVSTFQKQGLANEIKGSISFLASQSCVDGVVLFDHNMIATGFGAVLKTKKMPKKIFVSGTATALPKALKPADPYHFGTRHRSMISYCWNFPGSLGLVISQDGEIRAFSKIDDKLIMWENLKAQQFLRSNKLKRVPPKA